MRFEVSRPWPRPRRWRRVLTGDLRFDGRVLAYGPAGLVAATLTDPMRCLVQGLVGSRSVLTVGPRAIRYGVPLPATGLDPDLVSRIRRLVAVWDEWAPIADVPARWAALAVTDPDRRVRGLNGRRFLDWARTVPAPPAEALVALAKTTGLPSALREDAAALVARSARNDVVAMMLTSDDPSVVGLAVDAMHPSPTSVRHLCGALVQAKGPCAHRLVDGLARMEDPRSVSALVGLLARPDDESLVVAAYAALEAIATPAVAPILAADAALRSPGPVRQAALRCLQSLRSRFSADPGWADAGALSIVPEGPAGRLSVCDDDPTA